MTLLLGSILLFANFPSSKTETLDLLQRFGTALSCTGYAGSLIQQELTMAFDDTLFYAQQLERHAPASLHRFLRATRVLESVTGRVTNYACHAQLSYLLYSISKESDVFQNTVRWEPLTRD